MCFLYPSVVWQSWRRDWNRMKYLVFQPGSQYPCFASGIFVEA